MQMRRLMADEQEENGEDAEAFRVRRNREIDGQIERHQNDLDEIQQIERRRRIVAARLPQQNRQSPPPRRRNYPFEEENENNDNEEIRPYLMRRRNRENANENEPGPARLWRPRHQQNNQNNQNNVPPEPFQPNQLQVIEISDNDEEPAFVMEQPVFNLEENSDDDFEGAFMRAVQPPQEPRDQNEEGIVEDHNEDEGQNQVPQEPREQPANEQAGHARSLDIQRPGRHLLLSDTDDSSEDSNAEF